MSFTAPSAAVTIRPVERADVPAVVALITEVLAEFELEFGDGSETDKQLYDLPAAYTDVGGGFWVACDDAGSIVGTVGAHPVGASYMELRKMYLAAAGRGHGVGARLLGTAIDFARAAGAEALVLDTTEAMRQAITFYERHGFVRDDEQIRGSRCTRGYCLLLRAR